MGNPTNDTAECLTLGIDHLGLTVELDKTLPFFIDCLGWKQVGGKPEYPSAFITDGTSILTLWQVKTEQPVTFDRKTNMGLHHLAFKIDSEDKLRRLFERVKNWQNVNVEFEPEFSGAGPKVHFMINEPSGNRIEFSYRPATV